MAEWSVSIPLHGAGGEPVDLARTLLSHGVADLPPNVIASDGSSLDTVLPAAGGAWWVRLAADPPARGRHHATEVPARGRLDATDLPARARLGAVPAAAVPPAAARPELLAQMRHMLRLDEDLSGFYVVAAADPPLAWAAAGAGRMLRSPTVFEDLVKTICTTNCTWSATERMVGALVGQLGPPAAGAPDRRGFPTPETMAQAGEEFYRDTARAGYRGAYLRALADDVASGELDLEAFDDPELPDQLVAESLLAIAGVGPYAMAHMMMLLGRYRRLILDSWTRPTYRRLAGRPRVTDKGIERAFRRYREFAGLAFWLTLTESWVTEAQAP